jgi:hypothetical protein
MYNYYVQDRIGNSWTGMAIDADAAQENAITAWEAQGYMHAEVVTIRRVRTA